jgi:hypothetical protein
MDEGQTDLTELLQILRIMRTIDRYFRALDERQFDTSLFREIFAEAARIVRPDGSETVGPEAIATSHVATFAHFKATQHILANHDVSITNDAARVRANIVAIHLWKVTAADADMMDASFSAGGVLTARLAHGTSTRFATTSSGGSARTSRRCCRSFNRDFVRAAVGDQSGAGRVTPPSTNGKWLAISSPMSPSFEPTLRNESLELEEIASGAGEKSFRAFLREWGASPGSRRAS